MYPPGSVPTPSSAAPMAKNSDFQLATQPLKNKDIISYNQVRLLPR